MNKKTIILTLVLTTMLVGCNLSVTTPELPETNPVEQTTEVNPDAGLISIDEIALGKTFGAWTVSNIDRLACISKGNTFLKVEDDTCPAGTNASPWGTVIGFSGKTEIEAEITLVGEENPFQAGLVCTEFLSAGETAKLPNPNPDKVSNYFCLSENTEALVSELSLKADKSVKVNLTISDYVYNGIEGEIWDTAKYVPGTASIQ